MKIRVHTTNDTIDIAQSLPKNAAVALSQAQKTAESLAAKGVWTSDGRKFYPAKDIVFIEVME